MHSQSVAADLFRFLVSFSRLPILVLYMRKSYTHHKNQNLLACVVVSVPLVLARPRTKARARQNPRTHCVVPRQ
ncbi:hypothetical protein BVRB_3g064760 [Beta vulgaris subsp. vulgaris]|nr:hypothetical protein BVRB_3g064760 [Beta vulgaris subsp. vulgaris]